jgi:hypothetical protein
VHVPGREVRDAVDSRERPLGARAIAHDREARRARDVFLELPVGAAQRDQVFRASEHEHVGLGGVVVPGQALLGLARDGREAEREPIPEGPVARARVVGERELWPEPGATWARGERDREPRRARDRIGCELLAHAPNGASTLREPERRWSDRDPGRCARRETGLSRACGLSFALVPLHCPEG